MEDVNVGIHVFAATTLGKGPKLGVFTPAKPRYYLRVVEMAPEPVWTCTVKKIYTLHSARVDQPVAMPLPLEPPGPQYL